MGATTFPPSASVPFNIPCEGPHLGELGHTRSGSGHTIANGHPCFRVTQLFDTIDYYWTTQHPNPTPTQLASAPRHRALDFGNHNCSDIWEAPADGVATRYGPDQYGALAVIIQHPDGYKSLCWHVGSFLIPTGSTPVKRGQPIARIGDTGLGAVCHGHWEVHRYGVKVDPWPLLKQNYNWEADVKIQGKWRGHVVNKRTNLSVNARFRAAPNTNEESGTTLQVFNEGQGFRPVVEVGGQEIGGNDTWYGGVLWIEKKGMTFGYLHSSVLDPLTDAQATDGFTQEELDAAVAKARNAGRQAGIQAARDDLADLK